MDELRVWIERMSAGGVSENRLALYLGVNRSSISRVRGGRGIRATSALGRVWDRYGGELDDIDASALLERVAGIESGDAVSLLDELELEEKAGDSGVLDAISPALGVDSEFGDADAQGGSDDVGLDAVSDADSVGNGVVGGTGIGGLCVEIGALDEGAALDGGDVADADVGVDGVMVVDGSDALSGVVFDEVAADDGAGIDADGFIVTGDGARAVDDAVADAVVGVSRDSGIVSSVSAVGVSRVEPSVAVSVDDGKAAVNERIEKAGIDAGLVFGLREKLRYWTTLEERDAARAAWDTLDGGGDAQLERLRLLIEQSETKEEIAAYSAGSVLLSVPGLSLANARECGLRKIGGWHPSSGDSLPGLEGDAALLFYFGVESSYKDAGAREVAFADKGRKWSGADSLSALELRYGITAEERMRRYAYASHNERPARIGFYRLSSWVPERPYPDSDWFFGSEGNRRPNGVWMPSLAELAAYYYRILGLRAAYEGTAGQDGALWHEIELRHLECQYVMLDPDYWCTFYFHGVGRRIGGSTRSFERHDLRARIYELDGRLRELRRSWRRGARWLKGKVGHAADVGDVVGVGDYAADVVGWRNRDRRRWYDAGVGCLSANAGDYLEMLPDAMAYDWGGVVRREREVPGSREREFEYSRWRI